MHPVKRVIFETKKFKFESGSNLRKYTVTQLLEIMNEACKEIHFSLLEEGGDYKIVAIEEKA